MALYVVLVLFILARSNGAWSNRARSNGAWSNRAWSDSAVAFYVSLVLILFLLRSDSAWSDSAWSDSTRSDGSMAFYVWVLSYFLVLDLLFAHR